MNPIDLLVVPFLLLAALAGARAGLFGPVLGLAGAIGGFALALLAAAVLRQPMSAVEQPLRAFVTLAALAAFVGAGEAIGAGIGSSLSRRIRHGFLRPLEAIGGAGIGVAHVLLGIWVLGGLVAAGTVPGLGPTARDSIALRIVHDRLPEPSTVAGRILALVDTTDLPRLFAGIEPLPAAPVELPPDAEAAALAESALASTVRVSSRGCGIGTSVGSGFFVGPQHAITNAHVVAGGTDTTVVTEGGIHDATVVAFDPQADLALLYVSDVSATPLALSPSAPGRGSTGVALGFPGGGDLTVSAAAVTATYRIGGPDIYGDESDAPRSVVELRADVRGGNSGGPLVVEPGVAGGIIFGASRMDPGVGYAIGADEAVAQIGPSIGSTAPVATGACL